MAGYVRCFLCVMSQCDNGATSFDRHSSPECYSTLWPLPPPTKYLPICFTFAAPHCVRPIFLHFLRLLLHPWLLYYCRQTTGDGALTKLLHTFRIYW